MNAMRCNLMRSLLEIQDIYLETFFYTNLLIVIDTFCVSNNIKSRFLSVGTCTRIKDCVARLLGLVF